MEHSLTPLFDRLKERKFGDALNPQSPQQGPSPALCNSPTLPVSSSSSSKKKKKPRRLLAKISGTALSESLPEISIASANMIRDLMKFKLQQAEMDSIDVWSSVELLIADALEKREIKDCVLSLIELLDTVEGQLELEGYEPLSPLEELRVVLEGYRDRHLAPSISRHENSLTTKVAVLTLTSCLLLTLVNTIRADRQDLREARHSSTRLAERQALHNDKVDSLLRKNRSSTREVLRLQAESEAQEERMGSLVEMLHKQEREIELLEHQLLQRQAASEEAAYKRSSANNSSSFVCDLSFRELVQQGEAELATHEGQLTEALARVRAACEQVAMQREASAKRQQEGSVEDSRCVICLEASKEILLLPCSHLCCCTPCALSLKRNGCAYCPLCRQEVEQTIRVYS